MRSPAKGQRSARQVRSRCCRQSTTANTALAESLGISIRYYTLRAESQFRVELDEIRRLVDRDTRLLLVTML